jgi:hypothetical protein
MDNSISKNRRREDNPMNSLAFTWNAILIDGTRIYQFDREGLEHKFQEVKDRFDELVYFNLTNKHGKIFSVNLIKGLIGYNKLEFPYIETLEHKENIRLIFFRRHKIEFSGNLIEQSHNIIYHLGFQYIDKLGNNKQIILQIDSEGNFIIVN